MNSYEAMVRANMWKSLAYLGGCAVIGVAIKVTGSAKPLWALLALSAPSFIVKAANSAKSEEKEDESES